MDKKKKGPFLKLVPANVHMYESLNQDHQKTYSSTDSNDSEYDILKDDPIIEMLGGKQIENPIKNSKDNQIFQEDESSQDELYTFKSQDPCIKKLKNSKTTKNEEKKLIEEDIKPEIKQEKEKIRAPSKVENKNKQSPSGNKKQRKIFEFGCVTNLPKEDPDEYYETIQKIYTYFNNKKSIPLILSAIHQSAGDVYEAVYRLAADAYDYDEDSINFSYSSIYATSSALAKYFI